MAVKIVFDSANVVATPTIVLAKKGGEKLGNLPPVNINFEDNFNSKNVLDFKVYKERDGKKTRLWNEIKDFRLIWCKEWDAWFEIKVDVSESDDLVKSITATSIGEAELSAVKLYNIEINTEDDIAREDYVQTVLFNDLNPKASLLHRISEKIPHYTIKHVDASIANIQRTFSFNDTSILNALNDIGEEIGCLFYLSQSSDSNGLPERSISVYDLETYCNACGHRGDFSTVCPECGSQNIRAGYGEDTSIFISSDNLADEINLTTDTDSVNICFKMEPGDDLMTAVVASCNPNGSEYLWYIPDDLKSDMSSALATKLTEYDTRYNYYQNTYVSQLNQTKINAYNTLINKYKTYKPALETVSNGVGFSNIINILYNTIDFQLYLESGLMPSVEISDTSASAQALLLNASTLSPIAVSDISSASGATVDLNVLAFAKVIISPTYKVEIKTSSYNTSTHVWVGAFTVTNYSDEEDTADTSSITLTITGDYETYIKQKIEKLLNKDNTDDYSVTALFKKSISVSGNTYSGDFVNEIKKYGLSSLKAFSESCQSCIDILIEEGISDRSTWNAYTSGSNLYNSIYTPYYNKSRALTKEIALRESEIVTIKALNTEAENSRIAVQNALNLKSYIGTTLWKEFCAFRRESTYSNSNYISDGLTNAELISRAREFLKIAQKELIKSATLQHTLSSTLKNLLVMKEFQPIVDKFKVGNWIRVKIDGTIYRLRLINYTIDFEDLNNLNIQFSDVTKCQDDITDIKSVLNQAQAMSTTYSGLERQAAKNDDTTKTVRNWFTNGLDATLTKILNQAEQQTMIMDNHGLLMRAYDEISNSYSNEQIRIINSTIAITTDNWETIKTAIGKFVYVDPATGGLKYGFGVNGETIVGKLIIGQTLKLFNVSNTLSFDENGLSITNGVNTFIVNPTATNLLRITKTANNATTNLLYVNSSGNLVVSGAITASTLSTGSRTSSATGTNGAFIDSSGNFYAGSNNQTIIYANGNLNFGNGKIVYNGSTLTVNGAITATSLSTGSRTSAGTGTAGIYISSNGTLYAGSNNDTIIYANGTAKLKGTITATTFKAYGSNENTYTTIGDYILLNNTSEEADASYFAIRENSRFDGLLSIGSMQLTARALIFYTGSNFTGRYADIQLNGDGYLEISTSYHTRFIESVYSDASIVAEDNFYVGSGLRFIGGYDGNGSMLSCGMICVESSNNIIYVGEVASTNYTDGTYLRGNNVRLYAHTGGGVYLGSSGSTAVTSDETLKDMYDIDDRYVNFFNNLNPVLYKYKTGHRIHIGFGAQSVEKALSDARLTTEEFAGVLIDRDLDVGEDENVSPDGKTHFDELHSLRYEEFITLNTMMIKKLQKEITLLKNTIKKLEEEE